MDSDFPPVPHRALCGGPWAHGAAPGRVSGKTGPEGDRPRWGRAKYVSPRGFLQKPHPTLGKYYAHVRSPPGGREHSWAVWAVGNRGDR